MARVTLSPLLSRISGKVGNVVFRTYGRKVVLSQMPERPRTPPSPDQVAQRNRFRAATEYGKAALNDPEHRAFYEALAEQRQKPILSVMIADFLNVPVVDAIDTAAYEGKQGDPIYVYAHDDAGVTDVTVEIADEEGEVVEAGPATLDGWRWVYEAQADVPPGTVVTITARALDRPGHAGEAEEVVTTPE